MTKGEGRMNDQRVHQFAIEYQTLIRTAANEEVRSAFQTSCYQQTQHPRLKLERRRTSQRNRVIIEFKDKGLFRGQKKRVLNSEKH